MVDRKFLWRILLSICLVLPLNAATTSPDDNPLNVIDAGVGPRFTNVPVNTVLYPYAKLPQACCIHPYNPYFHAFPVVLSFTNSMLSAIPAKVLAHLPDADRAGIRMYLNMQDIPWPESAPALVRAHALFPSMGNRTAGVKVLNDAGGLLLNDTDSVHSHDAIASPDNFPIIGLDINRINALWSIVTHGAETFVTRHILLPAAQNYQLENFFCNRVKVEVEIENKKYMVDGVEPKAQFVGSLTPKFFAPLLTADYVDFLKALGVTIN